MTLRPLLLISLLLTQPLFCVAEKTSTAKESSKKTNSGNNNFSRCIPKEPEELVLLWIAAGIYSHFKSVQAIIHSSNHGSELQSFYTETPVDTLYELEIILYTRDLTETKTFQNKKRDALVEDVHDFVKKMVQKHHYVTVSLKPSVITERGKTITLSPLCIEWNDRRGIEQDLRKLFFLSGTTHTEKTFQATKYSVYAGLLFYLPLFLLFKSR